MRGETLVFTQCEAYAAAYHDRMGDMVSQRMRRAILAVSSSWYTAWVLAGQPDLSDFETREEVDTTRMEPLLSGRVKGRAHE